MARFCSALRPAAHDPPALQSEFRRCRKLENPLHLIGFLSQWKQYADDILRPAGEEAPRGKPLGDLLEKVRIAILPSTDAQAMTAH